MNSCFDDYENDDCDYSDCLTTYPSDGFLTVKVSEINGGVPIEIYNGHFDTGVLFMRDTLHTYEKKYNLATEQYYTVVAKYVSNGDTIRAIDGGRIKVNSNKICDSVCYSVTDLTVNVKLKY